MVCGSQNPFKPLTTWAGCPDTCVSLRQILPKSYLLSKHCLLITSELGQTVSTEAVQGAIGMKAFDPRLLKTVAISASELELQRAAQSHLYLAKGYSAAVAVAWRRPVDSRYRPPCRHSPAVRRVGRHHHWRRIFSPTSIDRLPGSRQSETRPVARVRRMSRRTRRQRRTPGPFSWDALLPGHRA